jgi:hypothetical protein
MLLGQVITGGNASWMTRTWNWQVLKLPQSSVARHVTL